MAGKKGLVSVYQRLKTAIQRDMEGSFSLTLVRREKRGERSLIFQL